jgi:hypothetical protein
MPVITEALLRDVIAGHTAHYGDSHVGTINANYALALVFERTGRARDAREMMRQVVAGFAQQFDPQHPWLTTATGDLERLQATVADE